MQRRTPYVYRLALVAALGGLLFGYDTAVISGAIGFLQAHFQLDAFEKGWATASVLVGCIVGAAFAGSISDRLGRKRALVLCALLFALSAIGSALPRNLTEFALARILGGLGVGAAALVSPLYIAEISPPQIRGRLVSLNQFAIISGMLVVYIVNAYLAGLGDLAWNVDWGWRWMLGSETLPALLFLGLLFLVPESPRWLTQRGRPDEALALLTRLSDARSARDEMQEIGDTLRLDAGPLRPWAQPGLRIALAIGILLAVLQQVTGINVVIYYAPEIFKGAGLETTSALNSTVAVGLVNLLFTIVAIWVVDRVGRKPLLLAASCGMGVSLAALGTRFYTSSFEGPWVLFYVLAYVGSFALAMGPVVWVVLAEIFPTRIRGRAMAVATVALWIANFAVTLSFPWLLERLSGYVFFVYAALCVVAFLFIFRFLPETKGKTLEAIERSWLGESRPDDGVRKH